MKIEDEILINMYGQNIVGIEKLEDTFSLLDSSMQKQYLTDVVFLIMQSKPIEQDIEPSIINSNLRSTFAPCIMLKKGVAIHNLNKLIDLPNGEYIKVFKLLLSLFQIAYSRRFLLEKNNPNKWWYWDLSIKNNLDKIMQNSNNR